MRKKNSVNWLVVLLSFILFALYLAPVAELDETDLHSTMSGTEPFKNVLRGGIPHAPIVIDGDTNFSVTAANEGWIGDGSSGNPYIINGFDIDLGGAAGSCINITNTRANFTISNCNLNGANVNPGSGIHLSNVTNGKLVSNIFLSDYYAIRLIDSDNNAISDNTCNSNNDYSIYLESSDSNTMTNNTCNSNDYGIYLYQSNSNTVASNTCSSNNDYGIYFDNSDSNTVANNTCGSNNYGIYLYQSNSNTVASNTCNSNNYYGISSYVSDSNTVANNTCSSNINGIYLGGTWFNTVANNTCNSNDYGIYFDICWFNTVANNTCSSNINFGIYFQFSEDNTVTNNTCSSNINGIYLDQSILNTVANNTCSNNNYGIYLYFSEANTVANNTCGNNDYGIYLYYSDSNTVANNTCSSNNYGIYFQFSEDNTVANNTCTYNEYGIHIGSSADNNEFLWNVFVNNTENAADSAFNNFFDYNYWSDYAGYDTDEDGIGDIPYSFPGNQDSHPLMAPPGSLPFWLESPIDQVVFLGETFRYDLNASVFGGSDYWWINDTVHFTIDQFGVVTNVTFLLAVEYGLHVFVNDTEGNILSGSFTVIVEDWFIPIWLEAPEDQLVEYVVILHYYLNASDVSGLDYWWLNDTLHFSIDENGHVTTTGIVPVGAYGVQVWVNDTWGNTLTGFFTVTVVDTLAPTWVEQPQNQTIEYGTTFICDLDAIDPSGIGEWWVDDTLRFTVDWTGRVHTVDILALGTYGLRVYVSDIYGNTLSVSILVEVTAASTAVGEMNPLLALGLGAGIGGVAIVIVVIVLLKRKS